MPGGYFSVTGLILHFPFVNEISFLYSVLLFSILYSTVTGYGFHYLGLINEVLKDKAKKRIVNQRIVEVIRRVAQEGFISSF